MITTEIFYKFEINKTTNVIESLFIEFKLDDIIKKKDSYTNSAMYYTNNKSYYKKGILNTIKKEDYYYNIGHNRYPILGDINLYENINKTICKYIFNEKELKVSKKGNTTTIEGTYINCCKHLKTYIEELHTFSKKDIVFSTIKDNYVMIMDWFVSLSDKGIKELNLVEAIQISKIIEDDIYDEEHTYTNLLNDVINYSYTNYKF